MYLFVCRIVIAVGVPVDRLVGIGNILLAYTRISDLYGGKTGASANQVLFKASRPDARPLGLGILGFWSGPVLAALIPLLAVL